MHDLDSVECMWCKKMFTYGLVEGEFQSVIEEPGTSSYKWNTFNIKVTMPGDKIAKHWDLCLECLAKVLITGKADFR